MSNLILRITPLLSSYISTTNTVNWTLGFLFTSTVSQVNIPKPHKNMMPPSLKLCNGYTIPVVGVGTYQSTANEVGEAVKHAISIGYRHIDCAYFYQNEQEIGAAIREKIQDGTVKREDLFITSKLWNTFHSEHLVVPTCKKSLENLGLDYLDLYLIHWPFGWKEGGELKPIDENGDVQANGIDYLETWKGVEKVSELGLSRSIGLSNFNSEQIDRVLSVSKIKPAVNQVECNPNINQKKLISFCKQRGIVVTGFCPLGRISSLGKAGFPNPTILEPKVIEMSKKYEKSPAQIVLKYLVGLGISIVPKSSKKERIAENFNIFDFELEDKDVAYLDSLNCGKRVSDPVELKNHEYYPFNVEY